MFLSCLIGTAALDAAPAHADSFQATRSDKLVERVHRIDMVLHRGYADLVVQREVHNGGERPDQAMFDINLPGGAVAVALRTRARVNGIDTWFRGDLLEAEVAAERYRELTGIGGFYPKDPALLSWRDASLLKLQVFPCLVGEDKAVEYTLRMPSTWIEGRDVFELPALGTADVAAEVTVRAARAGDHVLVDDRPWSGKKTLVMDEARRIELMPGGFQGFVEGELAVVPYAENRALFQMHIDVAPKLSTIPQGAAIVIAIDASRSVGESGVAASQLAAQAYLSHFANTGARVAVLAFDRGVRQLTRGFVGVGDAVRELDTPIKIGNGSALDVALARANVLLQGVDAGAPRRVLVMTDLLPREALDASKVMRPSGAVLHVADVSAGSGSNDRDDDDPWAKLPRSTGGLLFRTSTPAKPIGELEDDERTALEAELLTWARPTRIEHVTLTGSAIETDFVPDVLAEGEGIADLRVTDAKVGFLSLQGELWSTKVERTMTPDPDHGRRWAAMVFGSSLLGGLSEEEMMPLAKMGGAVSPVTSYLAIEPGVRPSFEGLSEGEGGGGRGSGIGLGSIGTLGHGSGTGSIRRDLSALLRDLLEEGVFGCDAGGEASISVETTLREIVDVSVSVEDNNPAKAACVREVVWAAALPADFDHLRNRYAVYL